MEPSGSDTSGHSGQSDSAGGGIFNLFGDDSGTPVVDPVAVTTAASGSDSGAINIGTIVAPKRRGRKPGSTNTAKKAPVSSLDLSAFAGLFVGFHSLLAMYGEEWLMTEDEARRIAQAAANVARHYDVQTTQKAIDFAALTGILAQSYGTRLVVTAMRVRMQSSNSSKPAQRTPSQTQQTAPPAAPAPQAANGVMRAADYSSGLPSSVDPLASSALN